MSGQQGFEGAEASVSNGVRLGEVATEALRYWEPRRLIYNVALVLVVLSYFFAAWPQSAGRVSFDSVLFLFLLAVAANVLYCTAYVVDLFVQVSQLRPQWLRVRWVLLLIGTGTAAVDARGFTLGFLASK